MVVAPAMPESAWAIGPRPLIGALIRSEAAGGPPHALCLGRAFGPKANVSLLAWVPVGLGVLDVCENLFLLVQLQRFPVSSTFLGNLPNAITGAKLVAVNVVLLLVIGSVVAWALVGWSRHRAKRRVTANA